MMCMAELAVYGDFTTLGRGCSLLPLSKNGGKGKKGGSVCWIHDPHLWSSVSSVEKAGISGAMGTSVRSKRDPE